MMENGSLTRSSLRTPKAAAIAGMLFSLLLTAAFWLLRMSVPPDPQEPGAWLRTSSNEVTLGLGGCCDLIQPQQMSAEPSFYDQA